MSGSQTRAQVDKLLTDVSNGLFPDGYISESVFPLLSVKQKSGILGAYGASHLRLEDDLLGGQGEARRVQPITYQKDYFYLVKSHSLEDVVTMDDYDNVEEPFEAENDKTVGLTSSILTVKENSIAGTLNDTAILTQNITLSGTDQFSDYANSSPLTQFKTAQNTVLSGCGIMPNAAIMSQKVMNTLQYHPEILHNLGYAMNRAGNLTQQEIAKAMNVDELLVANVPYNSAKEGQTDSLGQIWPDSVIFYVKPKSAAKRQVSLGYYAKMISRKTRMVYKYAMNNPIGAYGIIVQDDYSFEIVNAKAGYLIKSAIA